MKVFCDIINQFHDEGKTIIIAAHDYLKDIHYTKIYQLIHGELIEDEDF